MYFKIFLEDHAPHHQHPYDLPRLACAFRPRFNLCHLLCFIFFAKNPDQLSGEISQGSRDCTKAASQVTRHYDPALYYRMTAYRNRHSCETTLLMLIEDWRLSVDRKELVTILSTDMSEAFDSLSHSLTLKKLDAHGFNSSSLDLISRLNRVKINGHMSERRIMKRGCPQGSSFGPLLWKMFQTDMAFHIPDSNLTLYADDHQLYVTGKTYEEVESTLDTHGQQALIWYRNNLLLANSDKFQSLTINLRNIDADKKGSVLTITNDEIMKTGQIKLLGVNIDKNFNNTLAQSALKPARK